MMSQNEIERVSIASEEDLKRHAVRILRKVNDAEKGGLLFLLNPQFALDDAGFDLTPEMRDHILDGFRYGTETKARMRELGGEINEIAGRPVKVDDDDDITDLLVSELRLPVKAGDPETKIEQSPGYEEQKVTDLREELSRRGLREQGKKAALVVRLETDDIGSPETLSKVQIEELRSDHPVVEMILEMRELRRSGWRFVDRETYESVKEGASVTLLKSVKFRRDRPPTNTPDDT